MKLFLVALFIVCVAFSVHHILAEVCSPDTCTKMKCAQVANCPPGTYKKSGGTCNCCSVCANYQDVGKSCEDRECLPGELICNEKKVCQSTHVRKFCDAVRCAAAKNCTDGKILLKRDPEKCRCCDGCGFANETENPRCKNGNYVN